MILKRQIATMQKLWRAPIGKRLAAIGLTVLLLSSATSGQDTTVPEKGDSAKLACSISDSEGIHEIAASRDGKTVFTASYGCTSRMWDVATGKPRADAQSHVGDVGVVGFSRDGRLGFTTDWKKLQLWDAATGKQYGPTLDHQLREDTVIGPVFNTKGDAIATRDSMTTVRVWDVKTGCPLTNPLSHRKETVLWMQFSPDGKRLLTKANRNVRMWDIKTERLVADPFEHREWGTPLINRDATRMANRTDDRTDDRTLQITDLRNGKPLGGPLVHGAYVYSISFGPGGLVMTYDKRGAFLWSGCDTNEPRSEPLVTESLLNSAFFLPQTEAQTVAKETLQTDPAAAKTPRGKVRFVTLSDTHLTVWLVGQKEPVWRQRLEPGRKWVTSSRDGRWLLLQTKTGLTKTATMSVFDASTGRPVAQETDVITASINHGLFLTGGKVGAKVWRLPQ